MTDDGIAIEIFNLDAVIGKLYALPDADDLDDVGEYIPSNIIMFEILEYAHEEHIDSLQDITLEAIGMAIGRLFNTKVKHKRSKDKRIKTTRYLLTRL